MGYQNTIEILHELKIGHRTGIIKISQPHESQSQDNNNIRKNPRSKNCAMY